MQRTVRELIKHKGMNFVPTVQFGESVQTALEKLDYYDSGVLLVMKMGRIIGIFSERDFARAAIDFDGRNILKSRVESIMGQNVIFVTDDYRLDECMAVMSSNKIRHLPVLQDGHPIALLSMRHIMEALIEDKEFLIDELTKYVMGERYAVYRQERTPLQLLTSGQ